MRKMISGLVAAIAVMTAGAVPAMACGGGLFTSCSPCGQEYVSPCGQPQVYQPQAYVAPAYTTGCNTCGGGWGYERLPEPVHESYPVHQYYPVNQGPTYTGPGNFAPYPTYEEGGIAYGGGYRGHRSHYGYRYGYAPHRMRYGMMSRHYGYGYRGHTLRRYY